MHTELKVFLFFFYTNYTMYIGFDNICMYMYIHDFDGSIPATLLFALSCKKNSRLLLSLHGPMIACRTFFSRLVALLSFTSNSLARTHALARVQITQRTRRVCTHNVGTSRRHMALSAQRDSCTHAQDTQSKGPVGVLYVPGLGFGFSFRSTS